MTGPSKLSQQIIAIVLAHVGARSNPEARNDAAVNVDALLAATPPTTPAAAMRAAEEIVRLIQDEYEHGAVSVEPEIAAIITRNLAATPSVDLPFDDYCAGGDCRNCKGVNCTCPHHAPNANVESLYAKCRRVWVCKRCGNCLDHCKHKDESNFHEDLAMPCSVKTSAEPEGEQDV